MARFINKLILPLLALLATVYISTTAAAAAEVKDLPPGQMNRLEKRITEGALLNSHVVNEILSLTKCPAGQVAVKDKSNLNTGVDARYDERRDRSQYRYPTRYGYNQDFQLDGSKQVRARATTTGRRSLVCAAPHLVLPPSR